MATRKPVLRKCAACGQMKDRADLIRVVRTPEGDIVIDRTGRMNGRGAYLCRDRQCLERAEKAHSLERSLGMKTGEAIYASLEEEMRSGEQSK